MTKNNYFYLAIISLSSLIGGAINYIYHPIMLTFMTIEDFGIFGSLIGIFNILGVLTTGCLLFLNKEFSKNIANKTSNKSLLIDSTKVLLILGGIIFLVYTVFSRLIANFLHIDSAFLIIITGVSIIFSFLGVSVSAFLRSAKMFEIISWSQILIPIVKLGIGVLLVFLSFNIYGAIIGFLCAGIFGVMLFLYFALKNLQSEPYTSDIKGLLSEFFENKKEIIHFFLVSFFFAIFMNIDVILVRNIFSPEQAGIYSGISVLGKFLIFILLSIETVYYGQIMEYTKENVPNHLIKNPIIITIIVSVGALIFNYFFGSFVLGLLKPELAGYKDIYLLTLIYYSLLGLISLFIKILVGWKKYSVNFVSACLTMFLFILIYTLGSGSLGEFIFTFVMAGSIAVCILGIQFFVLYKKN